LKIIEDPALVRIGRPDEAFEELFLLVIPRSERDQESAVFCDFRDTADPSLRSR
jgi:hypothetical protein